ncbi:stationary-phase-induced ribosome-associated protein [Enterobacter cloacae subsp. cloacae]|nr:stationary-phase-induced ribosome-associated protein [Enterobacter cloacae subsp. cloacae]
MKSNRQARHIPGLNYKLSNQRKAVIEGDRKHRSPRHRQKNKNATRASKFPERFNTIGKN